jgi:predicted enzyme related to lactoylglutathione lyase
VKKLIRNNLIIELHVPDLEIVKKFYSKIGFQISMEDKLNEKELGYLTMTRDDPAGKTMLNFYGGDERVYNQAFFKRFPKETTRGYEIEVTIVVDNIDEFYNKVKSELQENIVREIKELEDHDFKWKDFRMVDPFGFYLCFTELLDWGQE